MIPQPARAPEETSPEGGVPFACDQAAVMAVYPAIQAFVCNRLGWQLGEDVTSETVRGILNGLATVRAKTAREFKSYCFGIAFRKVQDALRSKYGQRAEPMDPTELAECIGAGMDSPSQFPGTHADLELVLNRLNASKFPCGMLLFERYLLGLEVEEIGALLGIPSKATVRMKLHRCLQEARLIARKL